MIRAYRERKVGTKESYFESYEPYGRRIGEVVSFLVLVMCNYRVFFQCEFAVLSLCF